MRVQPNADGTCAPPAMPAHHRAVQPERRVLQPLADRPRPAGDPGRAHPARDQRLAGRAGRDLRALNGGHPAARHAPVLPLAGLPGELEKAPTDGIELPNSPDKPVPILVDAEIAALLKACAVPRGRPGVFDRTVFLGRPDEVVLRLLLDTGGRVSELCGLELTDADLDRELAYVTGKGSRPRVVPFGAKTAQAVDRYLRVRALHPYASLPRLLLGQRGPMTPDGARDVLHVRAAQAGVADVHPHRFRHTFAHRWLSGGGQERDLMMLAGWLSDDMLSRYAASTAVQRAHEAHRRLWGTDCEQAPRRRASAFDQLCASR